MDVCSLFFYVVRRPGGSCISPGCAFFSLLSVWLPSCCVNGMSLFTSVLAGLVPEVTYLVLHLFILANRVRVFRSRDVCFLGYISSRPHVTYGFSRSSSRCIDVEVQAVVLERGVFGERSAWA